MKGKFKLLNRIILFVTILAGIFGTTKTILADVYEYGVYIGGTTITSANKDDVFGDQKVSFTPGTATNPAVLTFKDNLELDGLTITNTYAGTNKIIITCGDKSVKVTLTKPILLGNNYENNIITIKGNSAKKATLTIEPKKINDFNSFRPIAIRIGNTLILDDNAILQNSNTNGNFGGGMINVSNNATFEMKGGIIQNSHVNATVYDNSNTQLGRGGAIYVVGSGKFIMSGGEIKNCSSTIAGGAIFSAGLVEIKNGTIKNCSVSGLLDDKDGKNLVKAKGGAIYILTGDFTMTGGKIIENTLGNADDSRGAGVYFADGTNSIIFGGNAKIENNKDKNGNNSNLFLYDNIKFDVSAVTKPTKEMEIYVSTKTQPTKEKAITVSNSGIKEYSNNFISDNEQFKIVANANGYLDLISLYKIEFNSNGGSKVKAIYTIDGKDVTKVKQPTKKNMTFEGWYTDEDLKNKFDPSSPITEDMILFAKWSVATNNPPTGDNIYIYIAIITISIVGVLTTAIFAKKKLD